MTTEHLETRPVLDPVELLAPLRELVHESRHLREDPIHGFVNGHRVYHIPRFTFNGPAGGGDPVRIGLFAALHGDEPEGSLAIVEFLRQLEAQPELARGYEIYAYPICNPTGVEDGTRHSRAGEDLNRLFWRQSGHPEVNILERQLETVRFHGLVALHSDDTCDGIYAFVRGATLTEALARPAIRAAEQVLPRSTRPVIDGFPAQAGIIRKCYDGVLSPPAWMRPAPFEIIFETPQLEPVRLQVLAGVAALHSILEEYRTLLAIGQNL